MSVSKKSKKKKPSDGHKSPSRRKHKSGSRSRSKRRSRNRHPSPSRSPRARHSESISPRRKRSRRSRSYRRSASPAGNRIGSGRSDKRHSHRRSVVEKKDSVLQGEDKKKTKDADDPAQIDSEADQKGVDELAKIMGFSGFNSTKNQKVADNVAGAAKINKPRKYRQYMNRKGGFNRPLDQVA